MASYPDKVLRSEYDKQRRNSSKRDGCGISNNVLSSINLYNGTVVLKLFM